MGKKFKDYYDRECAQLLADKLKSVDDSFCDDSFVETVERGLDGSDEGPAFSARRRPRMSFSTRWCENRSRGTG